MPSALLFAIAKSIAAITSLVEPLPELFSTRSPMRRALGATPAYCPPDNAPLPATRPATCVPWP